MSTKYPTEEELSRVEQVLAQKIQAGEQLQGEIRSLVLETVRRETRPVEQRVQLAEQIATEASTGGKKTFESLTVLNAGMAEVGVRLEEFERRVDNIERAFIAFRRRCALVLGLGLVVAAVVVLVVGR